MDPKDTRVRFSVDRGGTFTDVFAQATDGERVVEKVVKLLSEDPANYRDAPTEGIRRVLEAVFERPFPRESPVDSSNIEAIRMGTTVATNALLERKGEPFALVTTRGFRDILHIGNQARPSIFDLTVACPETMYECVVEVDERVVLANYLDAEDASRGAPFEAVTGEKVIVRERLDPEMVRKQLDSLFHERGIKSIAVVLLHGALYPRHEEMIGDIAREVGFTQISLSHRVMRMVKLVPRGFTACADAYLTPHISKYLEKFTSGFDDQFLNTTRVSFMQSDGGLTPINDFSGHKAILSGPAGGVVGYALTTSNLALGTERCPARDQVVAFDMGGTSTDVSRFAGSYEHVFETTTAGVTIQAPQLDISTVAAGGGSMLTYESKLMQVGPGSVGAHPGPVCYRKGGSLAVTDANIVLGRLLPKHFPHIFGPDEKQPLDAEGSLRAFESLAKEINQAEGTSKSVYEVAQGYVDIANEAMCRPIRNLTQMKGYELTKHTLACFGGAGGQHACSIARSLGIEKVFIHRHSGILSAYGIGLADVVEEEQEPCACVVPYSTKDRVDEGTDLKIREAYTRLLHTASERLRVQGFAENDISHQLFLNLRFSGTDTAMMTTVELRDAHTPYTAFIEEFLENYLREFGFILRDKDIIVDDVRVRASGTSSVRDAQMKEFRDVAEERTTDGVAVRQPPLAKEKTRMFFMTQWFDADVYSLAELADAADGSYARASGPAIVLDSTSTVIVEPNCVAYVSHMGDITIDICPVQSDAGVSRGSESSQGSQVLQQPDPIQLSIFSHRFMGIAEQMGNTLRRTSISVNIKERLDFSCALFGPNGGLIANAPHIPVHLGAMQATVRFQKQYYGDRADETLEDGDVLVTNHPQLAGGSHLPDITVVTPCFVDEEVVFWVASRGHHADIGGISPGSMPPHSKMLRDEGASVVSFKLVKQGRFQEAEVSEILLTPSNPLDPRCSGTRCLEDNLSDLRAQVAANRHGVKLVHELIDQYGLKVVQAYMRFIQSSAERTVRDMLIRFCDDHEASFGAEDFMDDGTKLKLQVEINPNTGSASFDFTGTGPEVYGNCNVPPAVTHSAVIYCLRSMVGRDIPLNQGCLAPITIIIPYGSLLNPSEDAAVVGGNVLTSQRVVDVILKAFRTCAASQGCMNNLTFGDERFGYYETIAGGAGAGPSWSGRSGVHTHMTNTRITDPEILERRYPVVLRCFTLRSGSGGEGQFRGGEGVIRELEFLKPVTLSILSERRVTRPFGMLGGKPGSCGQNLFISRTLEGREKVQSLGGKNSVFAPAGSRIRILTPGGGGFGAPVSQRET